MRTLWFPILLLGGCSTAPSGWTEISSDWRNMSFEQRRSALDSIADDCKLARSTFQMVEHDELHFQPEPSASYKSVDCALGKLKTVRGFGKMGFVGNEAYVDSAKWASLATKPTSKRTRNNAQAH